MGYMFSIIYLTISIADSGFTHSLPPYLQTFTRSQQLFKKLFIPYFVAQFLIFTGAACIATGIAHTTYPLLASPFFTFIIPALIILEGVRASLRFFLHTLFVTQSTMMIELTLTTTMLAAIWYPYVTTGTPPTLTTIFIPYLVSSIIAVIALLANLYRTYQTLQVRTELPDDHTGLWYRITTTRILNFTAIHLAKQLFSTNFLITIFSATIGLEKTGALKCASYVADALRSIVKSTVGFSGNALLAYHKHATLAAKRTAFYWIGQKFYQLYTPVISFLATTYLIFTIAPHQLDTIQSTIIYAMLFVGIGLMDHLFYMYEQFYMVEEQAAKLFYIRSIEWVLLSLVFHYHNPHNIIATLTLLILIRAISLSALIYHAYLHWIIIPIAHVERSYLLITMTTSLIISLVCFKLL